MKFSFIIPIYKVEQYLHQCVDSVLGQTFEDFEVILVDDGSPDICPQICDEYARKDDRVKVIHKKNGGLSDARNVGLHAAIGEYIVFLDSDDFWRDINCLQKIMNIIKKKPQVDLIFFNIVYYDNQTGKEQFWPEYLVKDEEYLSKDEALENLVESGIIPMSAWSKVVKRKTLIDNKVLFQPRIYGEDIPWFIDLMEHVQILVFVNEYIYAYRQNVANSITKSNRPKHVYDMKWIIQSEMNKLDKRSMTEMGKNCIAAFLAYNYCILMSQYDYVEKSEQKDYWDFMKNYSYLLNNTMHPKVRKVKMLKSLIGLKNTCRMLKLYKRH